MRDTTDPFANIWDQMIHNEIALRNADRPVVLEPVYTGYGDYQLMEIDYAVPEEEQRTRPFPPPGTHWLDIGAPCHTP